MGIKSIQNLSRVKLGEKFRIIFTYDWIFSSWIEKIIVAGSFLWAIISIFSWIRSLF